MGGSLRGIGRGRRIESMIKQLHEMFEARIRE